METSTRRATAGGEQSDGLAHVGGVSSVAGAHRDDDRPPVLAVADAMGGEELAQVLAAISFGSADGMGEAEEPGDVIGIDASQVGAPALEESAEQAHEIFRRGSHPDPW